MEHEMLMDGSGEPSFTTVLFTSTAEPSSNVEFIQTPSRNYYLFGACDGTLVLEEFKEASDHTTLPLQRHFRLSPRLTDAAPIAALRVLQDHIAAVSGARVYTTTLRRLLTLRPGTDPSLDDVAELELLSDVAAVDWTADGEGLLVSLKDGQVSMWRYSQPGYRGGWSAAEGGNLSVPSSYQEPSVMLQHPVLPPGPSGAPAFRSPQGHQPHAEGPNLGRAPRGGMESSQSTPDFGRMSAGRDINAKAALLRDHAPSPLQAPEEEGWVCAWRVAALGETHAAVSAGARLSSPAASCPSYQRYGPIRPTSKHVMVWWSPDADHAHLPYRPPSAQHTVPRGEILRHPAPVVAVQWSPSLSLASGAAPTGSSDTPLMTVTLDHVIRLWVEVTGLVPGNPAVAQFCTALVIDAPIPPSLLPADRYFTAARWAQVDPDHATYQRSRDILWLTSMVVPQSATAAPSAAGSPPPRSNQGSRASSVGPSSSPLPALPISQVPQRPLLCLWAVAGLTGVDVSGSAEGGPGVAARAPRSVLWSRAAMPEGLFHRGDAAAGSPEPSPTASFTVVGWYQDTAEGHHDLRLRVTGCVAPDTTVKPAARRALMPGPSHAPGAPPPPPPPHLPPAISLPNVPLPPPPPLSPAAPGAATHAPHGSTPLVPVGYVPPPLQAPSAGRVTAPHGPPPGAYVPPRLPAAGSYHGVGSAGHDVPSTLNQDGTQAAAPAPSRLPTDRALFSITIDPARVTDGATSTEPPEPAAMRFRLARLWGHSTQVVAVASGCPTDCDAMDDGLRAATVDSAGVLILWSSPEFRPIACRDAWQPGVASGATRAPWRQGDVAAAWVRAPGAEGAEQQEVAVACPMGLLRFPLCTTSWGDPSIAPPAKQSMEPAAQDLFIGPEGVSSGALSVDWAEWVDRTVGAGGPDGPQLTRQQRTYSYSSDTSSLASDDEREAEPLAGPLSTSGAQHAPQRAQRIDRGVLVGFGPRSQGGRGAGAIWVDASEVASGSGDWRAGVPIRLPEGSLHLSPLTGGGTLDAPLSPFDIAILGSWDGGGVRLCRVTYSPGADHAECETVLDLPALPALSDLGIHVAEFASMAAHPWGCQLALVLSCGAGHAKSVAVAVLTTATGGAGDTDTDKSLTALGFGCSDNPGLASDSASLATSLSLTLRATQLIPLDDSEGVEGPADVRISWSDSPVLGDVLMLATPGSVSLLTPGTDGNLAVRIKHRGHFGGRWGRRELARQWGSPTGFHPQPLLCHVAPPGIPIVADGRVISVLGSLPFRAADLLRRTVHRAAAQAEDKAMAYAADVADWYGQCMPDFHPRLLKFLVDQGRADLAIRAVRLLKSHLEALAAEVEEADTQARQSGRGTSPHRGTAKTKGVILQVLDSLGQDLCPLDGVAAGAASRHLGAGPHPEASTSANKDRSKAKTKREPKAKSTSAYSDPLASGVLNMAEFGFGYPPEEEEEEEEGDSDASTSGSDEGEEEEEGGAAAASGNAVDSGLIDMSAFGSFGYSMEPEPAPPKEKKKKKEKKTTEGGVAAHDRAVNGQDKSTEPVFLLQPPAPVASFPALLSTADLASLARSLRKLRVLERTDIEPYLPKSSAWSLDALEDQLDDPLLTRGQPPALRVFGLDAATARALLAFVKAALSEGEGTDALARMDPPSRALALCLRALTVSSTDAAGAEPPAAAPPHPSHSTQHPPAIQPTKTLAPRVPKRELTDWRSPEATAAAGSPGLGQLGKGSRADGSASSLTLLLRGSHQPSISSEHLGTAVLSRHGVKSLASSSVSGAGSDAPAGNPWGLAEGVHFRHVYLAQTSTWAQDQLVELLCPMALGLRDGFKAPEGTTGSVGPSSSAFNIFSRNSSQAHGALGSGRELTWPLMRRVGAGYWLTDPTVCKSLAERLAQQTFTRTRDPYGSALLYLALGKKSTLQGIFKISQSEGAKKVTDFLSKDFSQEESRTAALKNAYALLSQHRYELAAAFFFLGGSPRDALGVACKEMRDPQLALFIARVSGVTNVAEDLINSELLPAAIESSDPFAPVCFRNILQSLKPGIVRVPNPVTPTSSRVLGEVLGRDGGGPKDDEVLGTGSAPQDPIVCLAHACDIAAVLLGAPKAAGAGGAQTGAPMTTISLIEALWLHGAYCGLAAASEVCGLHPVAKGFAEAARRLSTALATAPPEVPLPSTLPQRAAIASALSAARAAAAHRGECVGRALRGIVNPPTVPDTPTPVLSRHVARILVLHRDAARASRGLPADQQAAALAHSILKGLGRLWSAPTAPITPTGAAWLGGGGKTSRNCLTSTSPFSRSTISMATEAEGTEAPEMAPNALRLPPSLLTGTSPLAGGVDGFALFEVEAATVIFRATRAPGVIAAASQGLSDPKVTDMCVCDSLHCPPSDPHGRLQLLRGHPAAKDAVAVCTTNGQGVHAVRLRPKAVGPRTSKERSSATTPRHSHSDSVGHTGTEGGATASEDEALRRGRASRAASSTTPRGGAGRGHSGPGQSPSLGPRPHVPGSVESSRLLRSPGPDRLQDGPGHHRSGSLLQVVQDVFDSLWMGGPLPDSSSERLQQAAAAAAAATSSDLREENVLYGVGLGGDILMTTPPVRAGSRRFAPWGAPSGHSSHLSHVGYSYQHAPATRSPVGPPSRVSSEGSLVDVQASPRLLQKLLEKERFHAKAVHVRAVAAHPTRPYFATAAHHGTQVLLWALEEEFPFLLLTAEPTDWGRPATVSAPGHQGQGALSHAQSLSSALGVGRHGPGSTAGSGATSHGPNSASTGMGSPMPKPLGHLPPGGASAAAATSSGPLSRFRDCHWVSLAFSTDGSRLAAIANSGLVATWQLGGEMLDAYAAAGAAATAASPVVSPPASPGRYQGHHAPPLPGHPARWQHTPLTRGHSICYLGDAQNVIVAAGQGPSGRDIVLCDTTLPPAVSHLVALATHAGGCTALATIPQGLLLISGGEAGDMTVHDLRMVEAGATPVLLWLKGRAHDAAITCLATGKLRGRDLLVSGAKDGSVKVWDVRRQELLQTIDLAHCVEKHTPSFLTLAFSRKKGPPGSESKHGVAVCSVSLQDEGLVTAGHDGFIKLYPWTRALAAAVQAPQPGSSANGSSAGGGVYHPGSTAATPRAY